MGSPRLDPGSLGPEWQLGPHGRFERSAARVLLFDAADRILLVRGHDVSDPRRTWWFTIGGGIDDGESPRDAAARELFEETGLRLEPAMLVGPVFTRVADFEFFAQPARQHELFFVGRLDQPGELDDSGWTDIERDFVDESRWWSLPDLAASGVEIFPADLAARATDLLGGWDGTLRDLGHRHEDG